MIRLKQCQPNDYDIYDLCKELSEGQIIQYQKANGGSFNCYEVAEQVIDKIESGVCFAFESDDNEVKIICGFEMVRPMVFQTWMVHSYDLFTKKYDWFNLSRKLNRLIKKMLYSGYCHRVQDYCDSSRLCAMKWIHSALGMKFEHVEKKHYTDGSDAYCFVRVIDGNV